MYNNKKQPYLAPAVKVVEYKVERGFQATLPTTSVGTTPDTDGTDAYDRESTTNNWHF